MHLHPKPSVCIEGFLKFLGAMPAVDVSLPSEVQTQGLEVQGLLACGSLKSKVDLWFGDFGSGGLGFRV